MWKLVCCFLLFGIALASLTECKDESRENTLSVLYTRQKPRDCTKLNVCQVDCKKLIPSCKSKKTTAYFTFSISSRPAEQNAYRRMCLFDGKSKNGSFWTEDGHEIVSSLNSDIKRLLSKKVKWQDSFEALLNNEKIRGRNVALALMKLTNLLHLFSRTVIRIPTWRRNLKERINVITGIGKVDPTIVDKLRNKYPLTKVDKVRLAHIKRNMHLIRAGVWRPFTNKVKWARYQVDLTYAQLSRVDKRDYRRLAREIKKEYTEYLLDLAEQHTGEFCDCTSFGKYTQEKFKQYRDTKKRLKTVRALIAERIIPRVPKNLSIKLQNEVMGKALAGLHVLRRKEEYQTRRMIEHCRVNVCGVKSLIPKKTVQKPKKTFIIIPKPKATPAKEVTQITPKTQGSFIPGTHPGYGKK